MKDTKDRSAHRWAMMVGGVVLTVAGLVAGTAGVASAHHAAMQATADCSGNVHWTATSWQTDNPLARENPNIQISYMVNAEPPAVVVGNGAFTAQNGYSFSGNFQWPANANTLRIRGAALGQWGDGGAAGGEYDIFIDRPNMPCDTTTTEAATTTTAAETTTTAAATTTTQVGSDGPTTTLAGTTTTQVGSDGPTTTTTRSLPSTGSSSGSLPMIGGGLLLIGGAFVLTARRRTA